MTARAAALVVTAALAGCGGDDALSVQEVRVPHADATAFAIGDGRALTVAHVLAEGGPVRVGDRRARVLAVDRRLDIALLAVDGEDAAARGGAARADDRVTVRVLRSGREQSLRATVRRTITARLAGHSRPALELAAAVMPGDSGAPVVDTRGRVVGVVFAEASDRRSLAYAVDARALGSLLPAPLD
jgi:S1-C subfamily serine protease